MGEQNRVDLAFSRFFPSLKGVLGPKMAKTWVDLAHFSLFGAFFRALPASIWGHCLQVLVFISIWETPQNAKSTPFYPYTGGDSRLWASQETSSRLLAADFKALRGLPKHPRA